MSVEEDRISELPKDILVSILSLLTLKEAGRTCVLSHKWEKLWTLIPILNFDASATLVNLKSQGDDEELLAIERSKYINWVSCVLVAHQAPTIDEFKIQRGLPFDICRWLNFAFERKVKRLVLDFSQDVGIGEVSFRTVCLRFDFLTSLHLDSIDISGDAVEYFINNCPYLERLVVAHSSNTDGLKIAVPALKHLEIILCHPMRSLQISAPNLLYFKYHGSRTNMHSENVPNLVELVLGTDLDTFNKFIQLSSCFSRLQKLHLYDKHMLEQDLRFCEFPVFRLLKQLVVETRVWEGQSLLGFSSLVKASPSLNSLQLKLHYCGWWGEKREESAPICLHHSLKVVEWVGFFGRMTDLEFLYYLLKNAIVLEKIIIDPRNPRLLTPGTYPDNERTQDRRQRAKLIKRNFRSLRDKLVIL